MLILMGILGLLQSVLLPGLIIIKTGKLRGGITEQLLRLVPLSLTANYLCVFLLAALRFYRRPVMLGLILAEIAAVIWLYRETLFQPLNTAFSSLSEAFRRELRPLGDFLTENPSGRKNILSSWIWVLSGCFAFSGVVWALHLCRLNFGTIFTGWDTVFSWNAWAEMWAGGSIPKVAGLYPQLLPVNWSVSYVLQEKEWLQFFNTLLPPIFFLMIQQMFFDLGFQRRESAFFFAAVISRFMMKKLMGDQLFDGYMDVPAAAMCLLSLYSFLKAEGRSFAEQRQGIVLGVLFAAAAAVTKQSGWIALLLAPLTVALRLRDGLKTMSGKQKLLLFLAALLIVLPWYLHCFFFRPVGGEDELIADGIMDFNRQYDIHHRLRLARETLGKYGIFFLLSLAGIPFVPKKYRLPLFLMAWPLTAVWAVSYSYDARNLAPVLPVISLSCGLALSGIGVRIGKICQSAKPDRIALIIPMLLIFAAAVAALVYYYPDDRLTEDQRVRKKALFGERLNRELLYGVFGETHGGNDIYTDYPAYFLSGYENCCSAADFRDEGQVRMVLEGTKINWLLLPQVMPNNTDPAKELIDQCIADGRCGLRGCSDGYYKSYCLYEIFR